MITAAYILLSLVVLGLSLCALNRMSAKTRTMIRLAYVCLAMGSLAGLLMLVAGHQPGGADLLLMIGLAARMASDRRRGPRETWSPLNLPTHLWR